jgi:5-methylcytosine-specific restriction endonuclease McrA
MTTYRSKAKDSFKTRMRFFIFDCIVNQKIPSMDNFLKFNLNNQNEIIKVYTTQYWQMNRNDRLEGTLAKYTIDQIYNKIEEHKITFKDENKWFNEYFELFKGMYPESVFNKHINAEYCHYCKISRSQILELAGHQKLFKKNERGFTMEIDRKNSNLEYTTDNCVPACYWCNNAKTDEFSEKEFKSIAEAISKVWKERLAE